MKNIILLVLLIAATLVGAGFLLELEPTKDRTGNILIGVGAVYLISGLGLCWTFLKEEAPAHG